MVYSLCPVSSVAPSVFLRSRYRIVGILVAKGLNEACTIEVMIVRTNALMVNF